MDDFRLKMGCIILSGLIDGVKYKFLLDTGSERSYILRKHKLRSYKTNLGFLLQVNGIGKKSIEEFKYEIPSFWVGNKEFKNVPFIVKNIRKTLFRLLRIQGILGWDILSQIDFQLDIQRNTFYINESLRNLNKAEGDGYLFTEKASLATYEILNRHNEKDTFMVDTGSNYSYVFDWDYKKDALEKKGISLGINGIKIDRIYYLKDFQFIHYKKPFTIKKVFVEKKTKPINFTLGMNGLRNKRITFLNSKGKLYIED